MLDVKLEVAWLIGAFLPLKLHDSLQFTDFVEFIFRVITVTILMVMFFILIFFFVILIVLFLIIKINLSQVNLWVSHILMPSEIDISTCWLYLMVLEEFAFRRFIIAIHIHEKLT